MLKTKGLLFFLVVSLWFFPISRNIAETTLPIQPFEVRYTIYGKGLPIGEAVMILSDEGNGGYRMQFDVRPTGAVSLFSSQRVRERVNGKIQNGIIQPANYEQLRKGKKKRTVQLTFDWQKGTVSGKKNDRSVSLMLAPRVVDPLSMYLLVITDLQKGKNVNEYTLVSDDKLKTYQVRREGTETVETPFGNLQTLRVSRQRASSDNTTILWFAPALSYLPVQISKMEKGKEELRMTLKELKGIALK